MTAPTPAPLAADRLRWRCDPAWLGFATTAELAGTESIVGQDAAVEALRFGLATGAPGHHVFVRGLSGSGRVSLFRTLMQQIRPSCPASRDRCFVRNLASPDRPRLISMPRGTGKRFVRLVDALADFIRDGLRTALDADPLRSERQTIEQATRKSLSALTAPFDAELKAAGLVLVTVEAGPTTQTRIAALIDGKPVPAEALPALVAEDALEQDKADEIDAAIEAFASRLDDLGTRIEQARKDHEARTAEILKRQVRALLEPLCRPIREAFHEPTVAVFLDSVLTDVAERRLDAIVEDKDISRLYRANLIVSHGPGDDCPIITEITPSMLNLLGTIDQQVGPGGAMRTDHTMIHAGALLRADGGFLLLDARDVLSEPGAWPMLVRALRTGQVEIVPPELAGPWVGRSLKPEPIDLNVKVVLVGDAETYALLDAMDPDFPHLFKVLADFAPDLPRDEPSAMAYANFIARIAQQEALPQFKRDAIARLVEHGARISDRADRLTARMGRVGDVAREGAFVAQGKGELQVTREHIEAAIARRRARANLPAQRYREFIRDGTIQVRLTGSAVGQVNGLAVVHAGPLVYGFPQRITATVSPGAGGVVNIEREADLSGSIHTKGFYILAGLLRTLLRADHPLAFEASIAFEQSYGGIDGDSASGAETVCLLSALTGIPARQDIAMTGAIDQIGSIMAIGAANEKIEGFFDACAAAGLTGSQGVIIPHANTGDLMVRQDVVDACAEGRFHVWAVRTIREAMQLLLDTPPGEPDATGACAKSTIIGIAQARSRAFWNTARATSPPPTTNHQAP